MELHKGVETFLTRILQEFSYHPYIAPYLNVSRRPPLIHYLHQYEVVARLALRKPIRVLLGDEIGLGKTITALAIAKYLERIGRASRILIILPRVLIGQWRKELERMGIPRLKIRQIERNTIDFLKRQGFPEGYYLASMDLLKREERIVEVVDVPWDLIIIDEAHKFGYKTKRFWELGKRLVEAKPGRDVLLLSATPHRGDPRDYISRLQLLDPYLLEGWRALDRRRFYELTHGSILFRRTKEDINKIYECKEIFKRARFYAGVIQAREDEAEFVTSLVSFLKTKLREFAYEKELLSARAIPLLTVLIFKRSSSSPYAAMKTLERILAKRAVSPQLTKDLVDEVSTFFDVGYDDYEYLERDPEEAFNRFLDAVSPLLTERDKQEIRLLRDMAKSVMEKGDSKLNALISLLEDIMKEEDSKVIVFTEYKDTLDYILTAIQTRHPEWSRNLLRLSSEETRDEKTFLKIKRAFEDDPRKRILIATDVVAEGVNLQVAHILINYEIPWSLIKLEQRLGRVWRLGQKREVEAYTLFLSNVADQAALNSIYWKLLNLKRAELSPRPITGQEILFYADTQDLVRLPPAVALKVERERKKFVKVSEERAILTYLRYGEEGLGELVLSIIAAKQEMEKELRSKAILYKPKNRLEVENTISLLGFENPEELFESMEKLLKSSLNLMGLELLSDKPKLRVVRGQEMPITVETLDDIYALLSRGDPSLKLTLVAHGPGRGVALTPIIVKERQSDETIYRELIGIDVDNGEVLRGSHLLKLLSSAISNCLGITELTKEEADIPLKALSKSSEIVRRLTNEILKPLTIYINTLTNLKLRNTERTWLRAENLRIQILDPIGFVRFVKTIKIPTAVPEEVKKKVERIAVETVMDIERREGRVPVEVPVEEHYDIKSTDPATGEVRLIEVKGHMGPEIYGELTEDEAKLAEEEGERYWLYIVYNIKSGKPEWIRFRNPLKTMNWKVFERVERRIILWPKR